MIKLNQNAGSPDYLLSLPPGVPGPVQFILVITGKSVTFRPSINSPKSYLRIGFWGDRHKTKIYPSNTSYHLNDPISFTDSVQFAIRSNLNQFGAYLRDMESLDIGVYNNGKICGYAKLNNYEQLFKSPAKPINESLEILSDTRDGKRDKKLGNLQIVVELIRFEEKNTSKKSNVERELTNVDEVLLLTDYFRLMHL